MYFITQESDRIQSTHYFPCTSKLQAPAPKHNRNMSTPHPQKAAHAASLMDPETFWSGHAGRLHWHQKPSQALTRRTKTLSSGVQHEHWSWFPDGEISTTYNCVDRHVANGLADQVAIIWESPVTKTTETYTYGQLLEEVEVLAGVLREEGVRKGDVVIIYSKPRLPPISATTYNIGSWSIPWPRQFHMHP